MNNILMEDLETGQSLLFFSQRLIRLLKLLSEGSTQDSHDKNGQRIDAEGLERFRHRQPTRRQPPPPPDEAMQLNVR